MRKGSLGERVSVLLLHGHRQSCSNHQDTVSTDKTVTGIIGNTEITKRRMLEATKHTEEAARQAHVPNMPANAVDYIMSVLHMQTEAWTSRGDKLKLWR